MTAIPFVAGTRGLPLKFVRRAHAIPLGGIDMNRLQVLASALTLSAATLTANGALADCAEQLASLKTEMGTSGASSSGASQSGMSASGTSSTSSSTAGSTDASTPAGETPAGMDQQAVTSGTETFTAAGSNEGQSDQENSTGALSGIAPTPALTERVEGASEGSDQSAANGSSSSSASGDMSASSGSADASSGSSMQDSGTESAASGETPAEQDQAATTSDSATFTQSGNVEGQSNREDSTGALSGVAPTPALTDEVQATAGASGQDTSGASNSSSDMASSSTSASGDAQSSMSGGNDMAASHIEAAQAALDAGNEEACMAAVEQAKNSMM
ncbi:hypothetical protein [Fulvimarina endophytica]|uniref:hypothetical protein n=1 Tax=Fulvimarina endophytica TaxID=2293836 RepID=UPI0011C03391|nr:hypothetical protein [Fulvimarina endophytica]